MAEEMEPEKVEVFKEPKKRPLLLSVLSLCAFVYFAVIALIFLASLLYSGHISTVVNTYVPEDAFTPSQIFLMFLTGFTLNAVAFTGVVLIWKMRRLGYYMLSLACILISVFQLTTPRASLTSTLAYIAFIFLFGLFFRRLR